MRPAFDPRDLHRPLAPHDDLRATMVWREERLVTASLTLHYNKAMFILEPTEISRTLVRKRVFVCEYPDGRIEIRHGEHVLPYRVFDKMRQMNQAAVIDNKHLDAALMMARAIQELAPHHRVRNNNEPSRGNDSTNIFGNGRSATADKADARRLGKPKEVSQALATQRAYGSDWSE